MGWRVFLFIGVLLGLQTLVYFTFINYWKTTKFYKPSHRWWTLAPFLVFNVSFIVISIIWGRKFTPPEWFKILALYPFYVWIAATFFISIWLLLGKIIKLPFQIPIWLAKIFKPLRRKINTVKEKKAVKTVDLSRRKFVRYATMGISTYAFAGATYGMLRHDSYEIDHKKIVIDNLPPELRGTTITLLSDIHAGQYMNEKEMREYADVINSLESDIVCIPGDFVNFESRDIHMLTSAFRDVKAKHGIYGSLGNHDFFQDADYVAGALNNESPIQLLRNEHRVINIKGKKLYMLGIDDTQSSGARMDEVLKYYGAMDDYLKNNDPEFANSPKVLLCHKPYGFDTLAAKEIDLVLSGHTHGGQVVPLKFGSFNLSFAATVSKYIEGIYKIGKSNMYVSRGIGSVGLPIRINCPPEITKITLV
ncbi:MAG TPA: metallophosphoesterase [Ignavibacteria bacterium]|nr:metallophosphoesterase [Ignavibacteria bacterium]HMQ98959.1 metallophosphoesterase [Ignavibacteria bacterium]